MKIKIISWNVNGIKAILKKKTLHELLKEEKPDILCLNEIKCNECLKGSIINDMFEYHYWNFSEKKKGYSGTAIFSNIKPLRQVKDGQEFDDKEGRLIHLEFENFNLINVYVPNSKPKLERLDYRVNTWDKELSKYISKLPKNVILTCDMNVANEEIDIHNPKGPVNRPGWTNEERESFSLMLKENKLIDSFRWMYPETVKYSYWDYRSAARKRNKGWRIDYFLVSKKIIKNVKESDILDTILGSDHAPILLKMEF